MKSEHIIVDGVESKTCTTCGKTKPLAEFYRHRLTADGLCSVCRSCHMAANMRTRAMRREFEEERKAAARREASKKKDKEKFMEELLPMVGIAAAVVLAFYVFRHFFR